MRRTKKPAKRKRTKFRVIKAKLVICAGHKTCWYKGTCPHKKVHQHSKACEVNFCSLMKIKGCKCEEVICSIS